MIDSGIIHFKINVNGSFRYLCNQAVSPNAFKLTDDKDKVTCNNCLTNKEFKKKGESK